MHKVVHLIPSLGIGGVECAAQTTLSNKPSGFLFRVQTIQPHYYPPQSFRTFIIYRFYLTIRNLTRSHPDLLIVSLWRSCIVGLIYKLLHPRLPLVVFLHFPRSVHLLDCILTNLCLLVSTEVWADSRQTLADRVPTNLSRPGRIISFVTNHIDPLPKPPHVTPDFIFWGRIHPQKCITRALSIFTQILHHYRNASFTIIGPDQGQLDLLKSLALQLKISDSVRFLGPLSFPDIYSQSAHASFFLQTSIMEGMCLSVVEAMQMGLVPVVTPVGEIQSYTQHESNSIHVTSDQSAVDHVLRLLENPGLYNQYRNNAISQWKNHRLYHQDVFSASAQLLSLANND